jgi:hypothetical protein
VAEAIAVINELFKRSIQVLEREYETQSLGILIKRLPSPHLSIFADD